MEQGRALQRAIMSHLEAFPEAVVVIEEYDKLGCPARGMLKQLLDKGISENVTFHRALFVLEANVGHVQIYKVGLICNRRLIGRRGLTTML